MYPVSQVPTVGEKFSARFRLKSRSNNRWSNQKAGAEEDGFNGCLGQCMWHMADAVVLVILSHTRREARQCWPPKILHLNITYNQEALVVLIVRFSINSELWFSCARGSGT